LDFGALNKRKNKKKIKKKKEERKPYTEGKRKCMDHSTLCT